MKRTAEISECGNYRWWLQRRWDDGPLVCFVMLNPSTADHEKDDPTIRRCIGFAKAWGFGALSVRNLFPYRATKPVDLMAAANSGFDVRGGERGAAELKAAATADLVIAAWGSYRCLSRSSAFLEITKPRDIWCLGQTKQGAPLHPLYLPKILVPMEFSRCKGVSWNPKAS